MVVASQSMDYLDNKVQHENIAQGHLKCRSILDRDPSCANWKRFITASDKQSDKSSSSLITFLQFRERITMKHSG